MDVHAALARLNLVLPMAPKQLGSYVPARVDGPHVYVSGQLPLQDGEMLAHGRVPNDVYTGQAQQCARLCALNALAAVETIEGGVNQLAGVVRVCVYIACGDDFDDHPQIANGASDLLHEIFGESGRHARAAIGVTSLPMNAPVEVEVLFSREP